MRILFELGKLDTFGYDNFIKLSTTTRGYNLTDSEITGKATGNFIHGIIYDKF